MKQTFNRRGSLYLAWNDKIASFLLLKILQDVIGGHVKRFVTLSIICETIKF